MWRIDFNPFDVDSHEISKVKTLLFRAGNITLHVILKK